MFEVHIDDAAILEKLHKMLEEDDEDACIRIREFKMGGGWHSKVMLGLSIDEMDEDEDSKIMNNNLPFIAENDFLAKHGNVFDITVGENKEILVSSK